MTIVLLGIALATVSWGLTGRILRFARSRSILDVPNHRSAHTIATPRGGGLAIVCLVFAVVALAGSAGALDPGAAIALLGGGCLVAGIGWLDDRGHVRASSRAFVHLVAAIWAVAWIGGMPLVRIGSHTLSLGLAGGVLACLGVVWMINLVNFMDGIDGIAGGEAVSSGLIGAALLWAAGSEGLALVAGAIGFVTAGFLIWNWAPAKIFMGDVGSGTLGFFFAVIAVASERSGSVPLLLWGIVFGVFIFDATATLLRRIFNGERWYEAHHSHAYQRLVRSGWSHSRVSGSVLLINAALGALAAAAWFRPRLFWVAAVAAAAILSSLYLWVERASPMWKRAARQL